MNGISLFPVFMIGLLGSVHCVGMCGGIVSAISVVSVPVRPFPVAVVATVGRPTSIHAIESVFYNIGRIASYATAGAIAGGLVRGASVLTDLSILQIGGYWMANLMLVALGLYLIGVWQGVTYLEFAGRGLWRKVQPLTRTLLPLNSAWKMLAAGSLWGWLPCGMVYSMLLTAMLSGSALSGATVMFVFGLGTLPTLLTMGMLGTQWKTWMQRPAVRMAGGLIVLCFGLLGLYRAAHGLSLDWLDAVCISAPDVRGK